MYRYIYKSVAREFKSKVRDITAVSKLLRVYTHIACWHVWNSGESEIKSLHERQAIIEGPLTPDDCDYKLRFGQVSTKSP